MERRGWQPTDCWIFIWCEEHMDSLIDTTNIQLIVKKYCPPYSAHETPDNLTSKYCHLYIIRCLKHRRSRSRWGSFKIVSSMIENILTDLYWPDCAYKMNCIAISHIRNEVCPYTAFFQYDPSIQTIRQSLQNSTGYRIIIIYFPKPGGAASIFFFIIMMK